MKVRLNDTAWILLSLYIPSALMSSGQGMVFPTIPVMATSFGVSVGVAAQVVTAGAVGRLAFLIPGGVMVDRLGRKPAMVIGSTMIAFGAVLTAVTPVFGLVLLAQFLSGAGGTLWQMAREIAAIDVVRADQRGRVMSGFMGMSSVGITLGPVLGGVLTDAFNFRAVFWVYTLLTIATLLVSLSIRETRAFRPARPGRIFDFGRLSEIEPYYRPTFIVLVFNTFTAMMRGTLINSILPLFVAAQLGFSTTEVGTLFGVYGLVNVLMIFPTGIISDKIGRKAAVVPSTIVATVAFVFFPFARDFPQLVGLCALVGIATGLALGTMATYTYDVIPEAARGRLQAMRRGLAEGGALGGPLIGGIVADAYTPGAAFLFFVPLQLTSALLMSFVAKESLRRRVLEAA